MKLKTQELTSFLDKIQMSNTQMIKEVNLKFEKDGLKVDAITLDKVSGISGWLKTSAFKEYTELGNVGLNELDVVIKVIKRFGEFISIEKEGNLLTIKGDSKKVDIELVDEKFISESGASPKNLEFKDTFEISAKRMKEIFTDVQMNKDCVLNIKTSEKKTTFTNTGKYKFEHNIESPTCEGGVEVKFGQPIIDTVSVLDGNLEISVASNYPCKVMEKSEHSVITMIVSPRVDD